MNKIVNLQRKNSPKQTEASLKETHRLKVVKSYIGINL